MGETDIAAELVRNGHVFAETGFFATYGSLESEAREAKAGIWRGEAESALRTIAPKMGGGQARGSRRLSDQRERERRTPPLCAAVGARL